MKRKRSKTQGFTLIEIMVVVVILGILAALVVPNIMDRPDMARQVTAKQTIRALEASIDMYRLDHMNYPTTLEDLVSSGNMKEIPPDPWGNSFQYERSGGRSGKDFDLYSYGRDGVAGGAGLDSDIGNWESKN